MIDFIEKLRAVEAGSMPAEPRQTSVSIDAPDPIDSGAIFEAR